jgi:hypothetical protein
MCGLGLHQKEKIKIAEAFDAARVTRLGDFPSIGSSFTLGSFFENVIRSRHFFGLLFSTYKGLCINFGKNGLGYILGDF